MRLIRELRSHLHYKIILPFLLLTLLVTPVVYSYFDDLRAWSPAALVRRILMRTPPKPAEA